MGALRRCTLLVLAISLSSVSSPLVAENHPILIRTALGGIAVDRAPSGAEPEAPKHRKIFAFDGVSRRSLTGISRLERGAEAASSAAETLRVVLIRVSFETDRDNALSSLSTGGDFDLEPNGTALVDPTPHDRGYFSSHMEALANYYRFQSCGRLEIVWDVLPEGESESYRISDLADYGPGSAGAWTEENLVRFFRDCIEAADRALAGEAYPMRFGDYDAIIVAHAGANLQSDVDSDTPNDVPSFFATLGPEDEFTVDGGATVVRDGSVIPETATQDGLNGGIAAVLAHDFGHQLGLPDLYNTASSTSAVGYWDLMDAGTLLGGYLPDGQRRPRWAEGFLPGGLSAWSRTLLGWTRVDTVRTFEDAIALSAVQKCPARVVRVEAASDEYFLIENRAAELDGIPTGLLVDGNGVIIGTANVAAPLELVNGYDMLLPQQFDTPRPDGGPGLLVWHVDERLVRERFERGTLNSLRPFAVSLLEASGVVDLGDPTSRFPFGSYDDAYYAGNNATLSDSTLPAAWSSWNVPTGVRVERISARDTLMSLGAGVRALHATEALPDSVVAAGNGVLGYSEDGILIVDESGRGWVPGRPTPVFNLGSSIATPAACAAGEIIVAEQRGVIHRFQPDTWNEASGWPRSLGVSLAAHPAAAYARSGISFYVVVGDIRGRLHMLNDDGNEAPGCPIDFRDPITSPADRILANVVVEGDAGLPARAIFVLSGGLEPSVHAWLSKWDISEEANPDELLSLSGGYPRRVLLDADDIGGEIALVGGDVDPGEPGAEVYIACLATGRIFLCGEGGVLARRGRERLITAPPALADLNGDSYLDLIYSDGFSVYAVNPSGANLTGWPRRLAAEYELPWGTSVAAPITVLAAASGQVVVAGTVSGLLYSFDAAGNIIGGMPMKVSSGIRDAVEIIAEGPGAMESVLGYIDGRYVRRREPPLPAGAGRSWATIWGRAERTAWAQPAAPWPGPSTAWLELADHLVVYPNPSSGERVGFHFEAPESGEARIEIMNIAGELVSESRKELSGGEDEFIVSLSDKASGVYVARIVIASQGRRVEARRTFAIVR